MHDARLSFAHRQDEEILWSCRPVLLPYLQKPLFGLLTLSLIAALGYREHLRAPSGPFPFFFLVWLPFLLGCYLVIYRFLCFRHTVFTATNHRLIEQTGVSGEKFLTFEYRDIQKIKADRLWFDRFYGVGSLWVFTLASNRADIFEGLNSPSELLQKIENSPEYIHRASKSTVG